MKVKVTVRLDDDLFTAIKVNAAQFRLTLESWFELAAQELLKNPKNKKRSK
jgi:hypothetical protein